MVAELDPLLPLSVVARTVGVHTDTVRRWMDLGLRGVGKLNRPRGTYRHQVYLSELRRFLEAMEAARAWVPAVFAAPARKPPPRHVQERQAEKAREYVRGGKK